VSAFGNKRGEGDGRCWGIEWLNGQGQSQIGRARYSSEVRTMRSGQWGLSGWLNRNRGWLGLSEVSE
jgi:hypothetical protein